MVRQSFLGLSRRHSSLAFAPWASRHDRIDCAPRDGSGANCRYPAKSSVGTGTYLGGYLAAGSLALRPSKLARRSTEHVTEMTRQMALVRKACRISNFR